MDKRTAVTATGRAVMGATGVFFVGVFSFIALSACSKQQQTTAVAQRAPNPSSVHPDEWPSVEPPIAENTAIEARINTLLGGMSVEQKVGQIIQADIGSVTPEQVRQYHLGSVLNGGNSGPGGNDLAPAKEWLALADKFYDASMDPALGANAIPVMWGSDSVHGDSNIIGATIFPHNIALGATRDSDLIRRIGEVTALETAITGQDWTFAPTVAVVRDDRWGRTYESYSEDPDIVREYAAAMVQGLQGDPKSPDFLRNGHVISSAKHFVGDGGTGGRDQGDNTSSEADLRDIHAAGYPTAIGAGVQTVMASYSSWQGVKMHGHRGLLTDVLKGRWKFDGFVVGDWNGHGQVPGCTTESCPAAINAGLDMFMAPNSWEGLYKNTLAQVKSGDIPMKRLDDAVRRILRVKLRAGLFEKGRPSSRPLAGKFELLGSAEHRAVARQAVRESIVLLKNQNKILPLAANKHVLVAGDGADNIPKQSGGWTLTWQGTDITNKHFPNATSIYAGIREAMRAGGGSAELSPSGSFKRKPDVAIVVFGENPYAEFRGDIRTVAYNPYDDRDLQLLRKLKAANIPVVSVFLSGRPLWVNREINASDAFVAAWLPGTEGGGVADVLIRRPDGKVNQDFRGRLSFTWPGSPMQTAVNRNQGDDKPAFAYGYGLKYYDAGTVAALSEDVGEIPPAIDTQTFLTRGKPGSGWQWVVGGPSGVHEPLQGTGTQGVTFTPSDFKAQEDARSIQWPKTGAPRVGLAGDVAIDLSREANGQVSLAFDYRVDQPQPGAVHVVMECGANCAGSVPIQAALQSAPPGQWRHLKILLSCFQKAGMDVGRVTAPFFISAEGPVALSVAEIKLESGVDDVMACAN
jgi:beta-glucosidase